MRGPLSLSPSPPRPFIKFCVQVTIFLHYKCLFSVSTTMAWVSKDDVRGAAHGHFLFSLLLMVFFGVGYHHTRATDFGGAVPYWVFGAVGGGVVS